MIFKRITGFFLLAAICFTFSGCANYSAVALNDLSTLQTPMLGSSLVASTETSDLSPNSADEQVMKSTPKSGVQMFAKIFDEEDCKRYLGRNVLAKGYQPVQILLKNTSGKSFAVAPERLNLQQASVDEVARSVHTSTAKRVAWYSVAGLFLSPFIIPAVVDGIKSSQANQYLDQDYQKKSLKTQILQPYSQISSIVFVPDHSFNEARDISMTVVDVSNQKPVELIAQPAY